MEVELTPWEVAIAGFVGVLRQSESMRKKLRSKMPPDNPFEIHVNGAAGEMAVSKALNVYWGVPINQFKLPDIGDLIQVRMRSKDDDALIVRPDDADDEAFVLVTGKPPKMRVAGWCWGYEAKKKEYEANPGGRGMAYFVGQDRLRPITELPINRGATP